MADVYIEFEEVDDIDLDAADIQRETDLAVLCQWYSTTLETAEEIKDTVGFVRETGNPEEEWIYRCGRKIAYLKKGARRIEQRILLLGGMPPYPLNDGRAKHISLLEKKLNQARDMLHKNGLTLPPYKEWLEEQAAA